MVALEDWEISINRKTILVLTNVIIKEVIGKGFAGIVY